MSYELNMIHPTKISIHSKSITSQLKPFQLRLQYWQSVSQRSRNVHVVHQDRIAQKPFLQGSNLPFQPSSFCYPPNILMLHPTALIHHQQAQYFPPMIGPLPVSHTLMLLLFSASSHPSFLTKPFQPTRHYHLSPFTFLKY